MDQVIIGTVVGGILTTGTAIITHYLNTRREREQLKQQKEIETERWNRENREKHIMELRNDYTECLFHLTAFFDAVLAQQGKANPDEISEEAKTHRRGAQKSLMKLLTYTGDIDEEFKEAIRIFLEFSDDWGNARYIRDKLLQVAKTDKRLII